MESLDDLIEATGGFGRFQLYMLFVTSLPVCCAGWTIMQVRFNDIAPDFHCVINKWQNDSTINSQTFNLTTLNVCSINGTPCDAYEYVNGWVTTVTKWDLVCNRKWIKKLLESLMMAGLLVGALLIGQLSDWYGRKRAYVGFVILTSLSNLFAVFSINLEMCGISRSFLGIGCGGIMALYVPYSVEFLSIKWRSAAVLLPAFSIGAVLSAGVEALIPNMLYLHLIVACLSMGVSPGLFLLPESPRWLTVNGCIDKAENVINKIAMINKKSTPKNVRTVLKALSGDGDTLVRERCSYSVLHVFKGWSVLKVTCICGFVSMCNSIVFFGISYSISDLGGNVFLNLFIMSAVLIPSTVSVPFISNWLGRRLTVFLFLLLTTLSQAGCLLLLYATPDGGRELCFLVTVFCFVATLSVDCAIVASKVWSVELYPTVIRNVGFGFLTSLSRLGGVVAPFAIDLSDRKRLSFIIMATLMFFSTVFVLGLPETKNKKMVDYRPGCKCSKLKDFTESDRLLIGNGHKRRYCKDLETGKLLKPNKK